MSPAIYRSQTLEISLGMVVLGLTFSSILYGIMLTQTYKYFQRFKRDPLLVKLLVFAVWLLNTVSVFFVGHASWYYLVTTGPHGVSTWSLNVELALSITISAITESFLAFRVFKLSAQKYWLTAILLFLALIHFVSGEVAATEFLLLKKFARFGSVKIPSIVRLSSAAICDTAIAASLCYFLNKKRTGFKRSDEIINYLILFSINSGLATSLISIASLITYLVVPKLWVYTALCFLLSRLYANTFLCCLNSRQILLNIEKGHEQDSPNVSHLRRKRRGSLWTTTGRPGTAERSPTQVFVVTETITDGLQTPDPAKIRNSNTHLKEVSEKASSSSSSLATSQS
ncbi:hypothetical protein BYT27DRAFT_6694260 [Phlegmacium glaucopus]|nr:hypothetical protein BYT27DRAFT_6694260 [Phlegmacium glaucopus]